MLSVSGRLPGSQTEQGLKPLTFARIDLSRLMHNLESLKQVHPHMSIMPVIKADAYGHGMLPIAKELDEQGIKTFAVSNVDEAAILREQGFKQDILLFESTLESQIPAIIDYDLIPTVSSFDFARRLNEHAHAGDKTVHVHVKIDTGMKRFGLDLQEAVDVIQAINELEAIHVAGLYTHFPMADIDADLTTTQIEHMTNLRKDCQDQGLGDVICHVANSAGYLKYDMSSFQAARIGIALYDNVMSVHSQVIMVKTLRKDEGVSYGHSYLASEDKTIAIVPIGYSDGYMRSLSNKAQVLIGGTLCPVLGKVTMDQIMADVTHVPDIAQGTEVVILGRQGKTHIGVDDLAHWAGTISYEIICNLGNSLPRIYE